MIHALISGVLKSLMMILMIVTREPTGGARPRVGHRCACVPTKFPTDSWSVVLELRSRETRMLTQ